MAGLIGCRDEVAKRPVRGDKRERKALRKEARGIIAEGQPEAREFRDRHGNLRLGLIPEATRTYQPREMQALKLGGFITSDAIHAPTTRKPCNHPSQRDDHGVRRPLRTWWR
jgi:hypothetical protein